MSVYSPQITTPTYTVSPFSQHKNNQTSSPIKKRIHCQNKHCLVILSDAKKFHKSLYFKNGELKIAKQKLNETKEENKKLKAENAALKKEKQLKGGGSSKLVEELKHGQLMMQKELDKQMKLKAEQDKQIEELVNELASHEEMLVLREINVPAIFATVEKSQSQCQKLF